MEWFLEVLKQGGTVAVAVFALKLSTVLWERLSKKEDQFASYSSKRVKELETQLEAQRKEYTAALERMSTDHSARVEKLQNDRIRDGRLITKAAVALESVTVTVNRALGAIQTNHGDVVEGLTGLKKALSDAMAAAGAPAAPGKTDGQSRNAATKGG